MRELNCPSCGAKMSRKLDLSGDFICLRESRTWAKDDPMLAVSNLGALVDGDLKVRESAAIDPDEACRCGHTFAQHDPIDSHFAGPCGECECEEFDEL